MFEGEQIHTHVLRSGFGSDLFVCKLLIDMYCLCFFQESAWNIWDDMEVMDEVSWNSIISWYMQWGHVEKA